MVIVSFAKSFFRFQESIGFLAFVGTRLWTGIKCYLLFSAFMGSKLETEQIKMKNDVGSQRLGRMMGYLDCQ